MHMNNSRQNSLKQCQVAVKGKGHQFHATDRCNEFQKGPIYKAVTLDKDIITRLTGTPAGA